MKKDDFIELMQKQGAYKTKTEAQKAIKAFTSAVTEALAEQKHISLVGFGNFSTTLQKGKTGKVPGTDKTYVTQDKIVPKFKAGATLKDRVSVSK